MTGGVETGSGNKDATEAYPVRATVGQKRVQEAKKHNSKCHVCKQTFEAYFKTTKKCSQCEMDYKSNV